MDSFLQAAHRDGRHHSTGTFTVDLAKARSKLSRYQLARFADFPKFLIPAAVTSGTTELRFQIESLGGRRKRRTRVTFEGWSLDEEGLLTLLYQELSAPELQPQKYLAIVLSALASKEPVVISSCRQGESRAFEVARDKVVPLPNNEPVGTDCLQLIFSCDWNAELFAHPALKSCWLPTAVTLDGRRLNQPVGSREFNYGRIRGYWTHGPGSPRVDFRDTSVVEVPPDGVDTPSLILLVECGKAEFKLIVDGMAYDLPETMRLPNVAGFLVTPHLRTDLSFQNLVQNQDLDAVGPKLRALAVSALQRLAEEPEPLRQELGLKLWPLLEELRRDHDMSSVETGLIDRMGGLAPTTNPESLTALRHRLSKAPQSERDKLFHDFHFGAEELWRNRSDRASSELMEACRSLKESLGLSYQREYTLATLLALNEYNFSSLYPSNPWQPYFSVLGDWVVTGSATAFRQVGAHPSWLLPLFMSEATVDWSLLYPEELPRWLSLWVSIRRADLSEALSILEEEPELGFEQSSRDWLEVLWKAMNGRVSLLQTVKLRSSLSLQQFKTPATRLSFQKGFEAREAYRRFNARSGSWPLFFWILLQLTTLESRDQRAARTLWQGILLDLAVACEFAREEEKVSWKEPLRLRFGVRL